MKLPVLLRLAVAAVALGAAAASASAAKEMEVPRRAAAAADAPLEVIKTLAGHFGVEQQAAGDDPCTNDVKALSASPAYGKAYSDVMAISSEVGSATGSICALRSVDCRVPAPGSAGGATVPARCCGSDALPLWKAIADEKLQAVVDEGRKVLPYPTGGLLWLGLGLEVSIDTERAAANETLYAMGWSHALPIFAPASCMTTEALGPLIDSLNKGCLAFDSRNLACDYNLLHPVV